MDDKNSNLVHFEGLNDTFDYNPDMYSEKNYGGRKFLVFRDDYVGPISLPKGCTCTSHMFQNCNIKKGCYLDDFDTIDVTDMRSMFDSASIPEGFSFGSKFNTSNVVDMSRMFNHVKFPNDFTLSNDFDITKAKKWDYMFFNTTLPKPVAVSSGSSDKKAMAEIVETLKSGKEYQKLEYYTGKLGTFYYDPRMYETVREDGEITHIHFNSSYVGPISLPKGCTNVNSLFQRCNIKEGCYLDDFDTSKVTNMSYMFAGCRIPKGFTLGDKFDTSNVTDMHEMFVGCDIPNDFTLGNKFDTSNVRYMGDMFAHMTLPDDFTLGDKFDTSNVRVMHGMFKYCKMSDNFTLGDKFDTSNVTSMDCMFSKTIMPDGFTLGDKFDTSNVQYMTSMFAHTTLPDGFTLGDKFDTSNLKYGSNMFYDAVIPNGFSIGDKFTINQKAICYALFDHAQLADGQYVDSAPRDNVIAYLYDSSPHNDVIEFLRKPVNVVADNEATKVKRGIISQLPNGMVHYEGSLGTFDYDPNMYELKHYDRRDGDYLHFKDDYAGPISLPKGCINTRNMFDYCTIKRACYFDDFDTSNVTDMNNMFHNTKFTKGITLGDKFDTSKVTDMNSMFAHCMMPNGFSLGNKFDISDVQTTHFMFEDAKLGGKKFNTQKYTANDIVNRLKQTPVSKSNIETKKARFDATISQFQSLAEVGNNDKQLGD